MIPLYVHRESIVHDIPAGRKLIVSLIGGTLIFLCEPLWLQIGILALVLGLYALARLPVATIGGALRPILFVGAIIFALQLALAGPLEAVTIVLRISSAILLTSLVTLTTRFSDMLDVLTRAARPLETVGLEPPKLALMVGLTIRFVPSLLHDLQEIRQAKRARGARGLRAFGAGPVIVRILRMTEALGNAIAARSFENRR